MTKTTVTFTELVRRAAKREPTPAATWYWKWCDGCGDETRWRLIAELALDEVYQCDGCGCQKVYRVR